MINMSHWKHRSMMRVMVVMAAVLAGVIGVTASSSDTASATTTSGVNATPYNNTYHPWTTDGCSVVPDWGTSGFYPYAWFDFNHACIHHDGCYRNRWADRATCDLWFLNDMNASCNAIHPWWNVPNRTSCKGMASLYYTGVRTLGASAYAYRTHSAPLA